MKFLFLANILPPLLCHLHFKYLYYILLVYIYYTFHYVGVSAFPKLGSKIPVPALKASSQHCLHLLCIPLTLYLHECLQFHAISSCLHSLHLHVPSVSSSAYVPNLFYLLYKFIIPCYLWLTVFTRSM